jgi:hypothetical protein
MRQNRTAISIAEVPITSQKGTSRSERASGAKRGNAVRAKRGVEEYVWK